MKTTRNLTTGLLHVMVVDDDEFTREMVSDMARGIGVGKISTAATGHAALAAIQGLSYKPDVVVCDINMPDKDGFELMESLAKSGFAGGIVVMSGEGERVVNSATLMARFHHLNFLGALVKPVSRAALKDALSKTGKGA